MVLLSFEGWQNIAKTAAVFVGGAYAASFVLGDLSMYWRFLNRPSGSKVMAIVPNYLPFGIDNFLWGLFNFERPFDRTFQLAKSLGTCWTGRILCDTWGTTVTDPEDVLHVLSKNFENYEKGPQFQWLFAPFLGTGIFNVNGNDWKIHRQLARPHFDKLEIVGMVPVFMKHLKVLEEILDDAAEKQTTVDIQDYLFRLTLDSIGEILFGADIDSLRKVSPFATAFDRIQYHVVFRAVSYPFSILYSDPSYLKDLDILNSYVDTLVTDVLTDKNIAARNDLLAEYVKIEIDGKPPTRQYLKDMLKNMLIAGRDTTAALLTWSIYELSVRPDVVEKIRDEIASVFGNSDAALSHTIPTHAELANLKYLKQVLNEVLRLHPSVPNDTRTCVKDDVLPSGYFMPAGCDVEYPIYVINRLPAYWGETANEFDPDRWEQSRLRGVSPVLMSLPFNAGPRICLGQNLAIAEAKACLFSLLLRYNFTVIDRANVQYLAAIILSVKNNLFCKVTRR